MSFVPARLTVISLAFACAFTRLPGLSLAHDIPNARIERSTQVLLSAKQLRVEYEVVLAELTLARDLHQLDGESFRGDRAALFERYARVVGPLNARGILVRVDDQERELRPVGFSIRLDDHPRFRFEFATELPDRGRLMLRDTNYASSEGLTKLALEVAPDVSAWGDLPPTRLEAVPSLATWQLTDSQERRTTSLAIEYAPRLGGLAAPSPPAVQPGSAPRPPVASSGLTQLLDAQRGATAVAWWATAFLLGMIHALQPGHGKTLVAAASLDGPNPAARGAWLGLVTAGCHLVGVVILAGVLWFFPAQRYDTIHVIVVRSAGCLIAAIGFFRVGRFLAGLDSDHHVANHRGTGYWSLGLAAGFVPCWDAVALVVLAQSIGRLQWGLALLVAFSLGLAVILASLGWLAGRFRRTVEGLARSNATRWLSLASGLILGAIGLGLIRS